MLDSQPPPAFNLLEFPESNRTDSSFDMRFQIDRKGLVVFSVASISANIGGLLSGDDGALSTVEIGNGRYPVFDVSAVNTVTVSACSPHAMRGGEKYIVIVVARDKNGQTQGEVQKELVQTASG